MTCRRRFGGKTRVYRKSLPRVGSSRHCSARVRLKVFCRFPKSRFPSTNLRCEEGVGPNKHPPSTPSGFNNFPRPLVSRLPTSCNVVRASGIQYTYLPSRRDNNVFVPSSVGAARFYLRDASARPLCVHNSRTTIILQDTRTPIWQRPRRRGAYTMWNTGRPPAIRTVTNCSFRWSFADRSVYCFNIIYEETGTCIGTYIIPRNTFLQTGLYEVYKRRYGPNPRAQGHLWDLL